MSVITFTEEKQGLIGDYLKSYAGGRKWHQVKAKIQDKAEEYADKIIADNAAENAEREAAEVLRQERLAMPAQRLYDGIDLTHTPVVKTESSVPVYKGIFHEAQNNIEDLERALFINIGEINTYVDWKEGFNINRQMFEDVANVYRPHLKKILSALKGKESAFRDNKVFGDLCALCVRVRFCIHRKNKDERNPAELYKIIKRGFMNFEYPIEVKNFVMWCIKNPLSVEIREQIREKKDLTGGKINIREMIYFKDLWGDVGDAYYESEFIKSDLIRSQMAKRNNNIKS